MPSADNMSKGVKYMPQDNTDPFNKAGNLDTRIDPTNYPTENNDGNDFPIKDT
jgi:hypothetical protein